MFLTPVASTAWRLARALGWIVLAVACGLVLDLAIAGLFVPTPYDRACARESCKEKP